MHRFLDDHAVAPAPLGRASIEEGCDGIAGSALDRKARGTGRAVTAVEAQIPGVGDVFAGKYRIEGTVGKGGMGIVLRATHLRLGQQVAIKMLLPEVMLNRGLVARFEREARAASQLRSAHVAQVLDVDVSPSGLPYMVMELLDGNDLARELKLRGPLPVREAVDYVIQAADAIAQAHAAGIVHRDLKPANLFLCAGPEPRTLKVLDFGISKMATPDEAAVTMTREALGTPQYMSPEQIRSSKSVDGRTDIWALGVILYQLLAGRRPFSGDSVTSVIASIVTEDPRPLDEVRADVPAALAKVAAKALAKDVSNRFATVDDLLVALAPYGSPPEGTISRRLAGALLRAHSTDTALLPSEAVSVQDPKTVATLPQAQLAATAPLPQAGPGSTRDPRTATTVRSWVEAPPEARIALPHPRPGWVGGGILLAASLALAGYVVGGRAAPASPSALASALPALAAQPSPAVSAAPLPDTPTAAPAAPTAAAPSAVPAAARPPPRPRPKPPPAAPAPAPPAAPTGNPTRL